MPRGSILPIRRRGLLVVRLHCSGDFYDASYARQWQTIIEQCPRVRFYFYTRSWRVPTIAPVLEALARLPNCRSWYSVDADTDLPERVPNGVRLAYQNGRPMSGPKASIWPSGSAPYGDNVRC